MSRARIPARCLVVLALCAVSWAFHGAAHALDVPPLSARVNDLAGILSPAQQQQLERTLEGYERGSGHQFALLTVPSLEGDSLEDFSIRVVEKWKLGGKDEDDGVLLVVSKEDRKMRIEVGYGLEGDIPDAIASRVVRDVLQPAFRQGDFYGGIEQAFAVLMRAAGGEIAELPQRSERRDRRKAGPGKIIFWGIFMLLWIVPAVFGRGRRRRGSGFYIGGLGGGGGFGGGGGGFGGGGASGSW